jgi:Ser/Thr protein kinase RdoA (MazF antagonist)
VSTHLHFGNDLVNSSFWHTYYNLSPIVATVPIGSGHIHRTYELQTPSGVFIAQQLNTSVFKNPDLIVGNLKEAKRFIHKHDPQYLFVTPIPNVRGEWITLDAERNIWRLFPFLPGTRTIDIVENPTQAYQAAKAFGQLTRQLHGCDVGLFHETIPRFHNLTYRFQQFNDALHMASADRLKQSEFAIRQVNEFSFLISVYEKSISSGLPLRITHNDTKINNVLFDSSLTQVAAPIDLDTLMPGYFFYDLGDMVRTYTSPVSEEEKDLTKIEFRQEFNRAVMDGYLSEMENLLTPGEKALIPFAGKMMTYIMALRFLTDFLQGDTYYHTTYPGQNLIRATNQFHFLHCMNSDPSGIQG